MWQLNRIRMVADAGTFTPWFEDLAEANPLEFPGYEDKVKAAKEKTGLHEAVTIGHCKIYGEDAVLGICDARFLMSSMGHRKVCRSSCFAAPVAPECRRGSFP